MLTNAKINTHCNTQHHNHYVWHAYCFCEILMHSLTRGSIINNSKKLYPLPNNERLSQDWKVVKNNFCTFSKYVKCFTSFQPQHKLNAHITELNRALWVSLAQPSGPFTNLYVKPPSHLDGSEPQSTFSTGTGPVQQGLAFKHNCHYHHSYHPSEYDLWQLKWQTHHTRPRVKHHRRYGPLTMCARCQRRKTKLWHTDTAEGTAALRVWWHRGQHAVCGPCGGEKTQLITQHRGL